MKIWKCIALGVALWGLSLIWPDINRLLSEPMMAKLMLVLALTGLAYLLERRFNPPHNGGESMNAGHSHRGQNDRSRMASATQHLRKQSLISTA